MKRTPEIIVVHSQCKSYVHVENVLSLFPFLVTRGFFLPNDHPLSIWGLAPFIYHRLHFGVDRGQWLLDSFSRVTYYPTQLDCSYSVPLWTVHLPMFPTIVAI